MRVVGWYSERAGGTREMRRIVQCSAIDPAAPLRSMIAAAQSVQETTGNFPEVVQLDDEEWGIVEASEEVRAASRFCYHEERPARDVAAAVTGLTIEVGKSAWGLR